MADNVSLDERSPVDNLPVAQGKRRRGRPRKQRIEDTANSAAAVASATLPVQFNEVKEAIKEAVTAAVKRPKPPAPESDAGIRAAERAVQAAAIRSAVTKELREDDRTVISPTVEDRVADVIAAREIAEIAKDAAQPRPRHWWLLRQR